MRKFGVLLSFISLLFVACKEEDPTPAPQPGKKGIRLIDGQSTELQFEGFPESKTVKLESDLNWLVEKSESDDWYEVSPTYGSAGKVTLTVSVEQYIGDETLNGSFSVIAGEQKVDFTVTQTSATDPSSENIFIEDANFAAYLIENFDTDGNERISKSEAKAVTAINCSEMEIASLEGIQYFTELKTLDCSRNVITGTLNLSGLSKLEEAMLHHNLYSKIDLSGCSALTRVEANDNVEHTPDFTTIFHTTEIDLTGCSELVYLELTDNGITSLDLSDCTKLEVLRATWNALTTIDVSMCSEMTHLYVRKNPDMEGTLDVSHNTALQELWCAETKLQGITFAAQHPELKTLVCYDSHISSLDLTKCPALVSLQAHSMQLTSLDLTTCTELNDVWLKFNQITALDVTNCTKLVELQMGGNQVKTLDLSKNPKLKTLEVADNCLESINLDNCGELSSLNIGRNNLQELDLSDCKKLFTASIEENKLKELTIENMPELAVLNVGVNELEKLNMSNLPLLTYLYAERNKISKLDLREFTYLQEVSLSFNELTDLRIDGLAYMGICELNNNKLERISLSGCASVQELYVHQNPVAYMSVYDCAALRQLDMRSTNMKSIDLSNNPAATFLFATENPQLKTVFIMENASYSTLSVDDHVEVFYRAAGEYDDVDNKNWGDEDIDPWANEAA